jgi:hypothetical protein
MIPDALAGALVRPPHSSAPYRFPSPEAISSLGCRSRLSLLRWDTQCSHGSNKAKGGERHQYDDLSHEYFPVRSTQRGMARNVPDRCKVACVEAPTTGWAHPCWKMFNISLRRWERARHRTAAKSRWP